MFSQTLYLRDIFVVLMIPLTNYPVQAQKQNCHNDEIILTLVINQPWT